MFQLKTKYLTSLLAVYDANPKLKMELVKFIYHFPSMEGMFQKDYGSRTYYNYTSADHEFQAVESELGEFDHKIVLEKKEIKTGKVQALTLFSVPMLSSREAKENAFHGVRAYEYSFTEGNISTIAMFCKMAEYKNEHKRVNNNLVFALGTDRRDPNFFVFDDNKKTIQSFHSMNRFFEVEGGTSHTHFDDLTK